MEGFGIRWRVFEYLINKQNTTMKKASESTEQIIKNLKRQRLNWFQENARDQKDYKELLSKEERCERRLLETQRDLEEIREAMKAKEKEMTGENLEQIKEYDRLVSEALKMKKEKK